MRKHKQYIVEWGSVNDNVIRASKVLSKAIWKDSFDKRRYFSMGNNKPYLEGEFEFNFDDFGFGYGEIYKITYTIYIVRDIDEYNQLFMKASGDESSNSSSDFIEKKINIVSAMIGGYASPDFLSNIMHEVDHIFEYSKGFKKNESLYQRVLDGINSDNEAVRNVSILMYYGFKGEQDAFAHQFYGMLVQNDFEGDFQTALRISEYDNLMRAYLNVIHGDTPRSEIISACKELGTSFEHITRYFNYIKKKMEGKLFRVYTRYMANKTRNATFESMRQKNTVKHMLFLEHKKVYSDLEIKEEKYIDKT